MSKRNKYRVRILDFRYLPDFEHLNFRYLTYEVTAEHEKEALEQARENYMKGKREMFFEELGSVKKSV